MNSVSFGVESGSEKTRKLYNRHESQAQILKVDELNVRLKKEFFSRNQYDIIVDSPWEDPDDALDSLLFISKLKGYDFLDIFSLRLMPGSGLFQKALDDGILKQEDIEKENQRVYRAMSYTYENFLFLLMRDNFLREGWFFRIAIRAKTARFMRRFFKRHGKGMFKLYASKTVSQAVVLKKRISNVWHLLRTAGLRKTLKILKDKIFAKRP